MVKPGEGIPISWIEGSDDWYVKEISILTRHGTVPIATAHLHFNSIGFDYEKRILEVYNTDGLLMTIIPFENINDINPIWKKKEDKQ